MTQPLPPEPPPEQPADLNAAELTIAALVLAAYTGLLAAVAAAVLAAFNLFGSPPDPSALWAIIPQWQRSVDELVQGLTAIAKKGWEDTTRRIGVNIPFNPTDPILQDILNRTRNLMVRTPDEVYRMIIKALGDGVAAGENNTQLAARVSKILDVTGTENWPSRAKTVAVTEVHRAYNFGALAAGLRLQNDTRLLLLKRWESRDDAKVRPAHRRADGQTVPVGQPFLVNLEPLTAPGDPAGRPENVINCRCEISFLQGRNDGR